MPLGAAGLAALPAVIGGVGNIIGGLLGKSGAEKTNQKQIDMTYDLTKNKHKYAMEDLQRSGLNPLLSTITPSSAGSAPKLDNPNKQLGESVSAAASSAMSMKIANQQFKNLEAENHRIKAQAGYIHQQSIGQQISNTKQGALEPVYNAAGDIVDWVVKSARNAIDNNSARTTSNNADQNVTTIPPMPQPTSVQTAGEPAKEPDSKWLQKNVKTLAEFNKMFGKDHYLHKKPKFEPFNADYWRKYNAYRYVEWLKGGRK